MRERIADIIFEAKRRFIPTMADPNYCNHEECKYSNDDGVPDCEYCFTDRILKEITEGLAVGRIKEILESAGLYGGFGLCTQIEKWDEFLRGNEVESDIEL